MTLRPLRTAVLAAALYAVVLVSTASAELHQVRVTLVTGQVLTYTVDVAPGSTATAGQLPPLPAPLKMIEDLGPIATPTPVPTPQLPQVPVPTPTLPNLPNPTGSPIPGGGGGGGNGGGNNGGAVPANPVTGGGQTDQWTKGKDTGAANTETARR